MRWALLAPSALTDRIEVHVARIISNEELEELLEPCGGIEASMERGRTYEVGLKYVDAHREQLKQQYPNQWVGVLEKTILAHGETPDEVVHTLREAGVDVGVVVLHHACLKEPHWVLASRPECLR